MQWYHQRAAADLATECAAQQAADALVTSITTTTTADAEPTSFVDSDTPDDDSQGNAVSRTDAVDSAVADSAHEEFNVPDESAAGGSGTQQGQLDAEGEPSATWGQPDPPLLDPSHEQAPESTNASTAAAVTAVSSTADNLQQNTDSAVLVQEAAVVDTPELGSLRPPAPTDVPLAAVAALTGGSSLSSAAGSAPAVAQAQPAMAQAETADHPSTADSLQGSQVNSTRSGSTEPRVLLLQLHTLTIRLPAACRLTAQRHPLHWLTPLQLMTHRPILYPLKLRLLTPLLSCSLLFPPLLMQTVRLQMHCCSQ